MYNRNKKRKKKIIKDYETINIIEQEEEEIKNPKIKYLKSIFLYIFIILISLLILCIIFHEKIFSQKFIKRIKYKNFINVAYAFDSNNYHYITHISMKSIMLSQNKRTYIIFYMLVSSNIKSEEKEVIDKICQQHKNCEIKYFEMDERYKELSAPYVKIWSTADFYRLRLPDLLPNEKKLLYLDSDTLIYKDLTKIYNYNITGKYFTGMLEPRDLSFLKLNISNYINTGVTLFNLEELRLGNISKKMEEFLINHNNTKFLLPINDATNCVCHEKNGYFPPEFVQGRFCDIHSIDEYFDDLYIKLDKNELIKAYKDPYIYHLFGYNNKPWKGIIHDKKNVCIDPIIRFYEMAKKTDYYFDFIETFKISIPIK